MCDHCPCVPELEARVEALLDELHDTQTKLNDVVRQRGTEQAIARRHPSIRQLTFTPPTLRDRLDADSWPPLKVVK